MREPHHLAWLQAHPDRSAEWLAERLRDGFDVHHVDGDHQNNTPANLVLIEHIDHMRLHGWTMSRFGYLLREKKPRREPGQRPPTKQQRTALTWNKRRREARERRLSAIKFLD
jgi:hypothetical protein